MATRQPVIGLSPEDVRILKEIIHDVQILRQNISLRNSDQDTHQAPEVYVARPQSNISGLITVSGTATGDIPGSGMCDIYKITGSTGEFEMVGTSIKVYNLSSSGITSGWIPVFRDKFGKWLTTASDVISGGSGGGGSGAGCGCCDFFACITPAQTVVTNCTHTPEGASYQYTWLIGTWAAYPELTPDGAVLLTYQTSKCSEESSSSSSSSVGPVCTWYSCPTEVCRSVAGSSSSSTTECGTYQFVMTASTNADGDPVANIELVLLEGIDVIGIT